MIINADLHLHGKYSGAVSNDMLPRTIGEQAKLKGLNLVATADILNQKWMAEIKKNLKEEGGVLSDDSGTKFILQTEIEDQNRVHHIILFPSLSKVMEVRERISRYAKDLDTEGRPKVHLSGEQIAEIAIEAECMIGPSHAFTPWTSLYKEYDSLKDCYGKYSDRIYFLELGLSADTDMADRISELEDITFLSNSDAHSPWPNKMGREFTSFEVNEISFEELKNAIMRKKGRRPILNVKFDPREGKYHRTRCMNCLVFYSLSDAESFKWRCPICRKPIKKGVAERIEELAKGRRTIHPDHRPRCLHIIPLSEIISLAYNIRTPYSQKVQEIWRRFVEKFGTEIEILIRSDQDELKRIDKNVADLISAFRNNEFKYVPGGAGRYGIPVPPGKKAVYKVWNGTKAIEVDVRDEESYLSQPSITDFM
ncbi:MAG: TIGR00375 family protein [Candidatus Micrarchaeota archaeon]|nr:TIGR00375 family protein [Candidatus Micrarchaeota archaeon]